MALDTVGDYLAQARVLLQDVATPYRYSDVDIVTSLNFGIYEMFRLRPDIFIASIPAPTYTSGSPGTTVVLDIRFRLALLYFVCGYAHFRDEEATEDARAIAFTGLFRSMLGL
jgi:hypothetical protein